MKLLLLLACLFWARADVAAQTQDYGAKGIFPVYETGGQWLIFDKAPKRSHGLLDAGNRFLVIGSEGAQIFEVARTSGTYGGACRGRRPLKLKAALLRGPRRAVGRPIIGLHVPRDYAIKSSHALYRALRNQVSDKTYQVLEQQLKDSTLADARGGAFPFASDDGQSESFLENPKPEAVQVKIDFAAPVPLKDLAAAFVLVEETQVSASIRRCMRLANGPMLVGGCAPMKRELMAETDQLEFVAYDPSGKGSPFLLAFTKTEPHWGDERWGFVVRPSGPQLFLADSMDVRCREGF